METESELELETESQLVQRVRGKVLPRVYTPSHHSPFYNLKSMRILLLLLQRLIAFLCISNLIKLRFSGQAVSFVSCTYVTDIEKSFHYTIPCTYMYLSRIDTRIPAAEYLKQSQTIVTYGHVPPIYSVQFDDPMPLF